MAKKITLSTLSSAVSVRFPSPEHGNLNGMHYTQGKVEVGVDHAWGAIRQSPDFKDHEASVLCQTGGYLSGEFSTEYTQVGSL